MDRTFVTPEENLAFDDELLERRTPALRFWESPAHFVVLGRSCRAERDVNLAACAAAGIPVLRRSSGGGTVLQGPGCLNYSLVLPLEGELWNVSRSYEILLGWIADALALEVCGTDLCLNGRKVSGNAQRRSDGWLLHHGTLLYGMDLSLVERYLQEPPRQPPHRAGRSHSDFLTLLPLTRPTIIHHVGRASACGELEPDRAPVGLKASAG